MEYTIHPIAHIRTDFTDKFGIPRQSGLVPELTARIVFEPEYRDPNALVGIEGYDRLWLIWQFSTVAAEYAAGKSWRPTVRPPRLGGNGGVIQAAGIGPKLSQRLADGLRHRRIHPGRGGVIKIMQLGVGKHNTHSSHYCTKLYRLNYTRSPSKKQYSETKKGFPRGGSWPRSGLMRAEFILIAHLRAVTR